MHTQNPSSPVRRRGLGFALGGAAATLMMAGASAPSPFYPVLQERLSLGTMGVSVAFAIYALALLLALLTGGSISDHIGRRPVISAGFLLLAGGLALVWLSDSGAMLYAGRVVQGIASGLVVPALSAAIIDFAPAGNSRAATLLNTLAPTLGLALGAVGAGLVLDLAADEPTAAALTFGPLVAVYVLVSAAIWLVPETSPREAGWLRSLQPRASVPRPARPLFGISVPIVLGGWATGGLFLSLGPSIVHAELHVDGQLATGLLIGLLPATGAAAAFVMHNRRPIVSAVYGASALAVGTLIMLLALVLGSLPIYVVAVIVAGTGFGTAFMGTIGSLMPLAAVHERAELFAALYIVAYLSFGIPAVIAGILATAFGLHVTVLVFGAVVAVAAGTAAVFRARAGSVSLPA